MGCRLFSVLLLVPIIGEPRDIGANLFSLLKNRPCQKPVQAVEVHEHAVLILQENVDLRKIAVFMGMYILPAETLLLRYIFDSCRSGRNRHPWLWDKYILVFARVSVIREHDVQNLCSGKEHEGPATPGIAVGMCQQTLCIFKAC